MKFLAAFALIAVVASASVQRFSTAQVAELQEIVDAIYSPSTDPATAAALEQMLGHLLDAASTANVPIPALAPGFEIVDGSGIIASPALVPASVVPSPEPTPVLGPGFEIIAGPNPVPAPAVSPVPVVAPQPEPAVAQSESSGPLVQIILNINQAESSAAAPVPSGVVSPVEVIRPTPVNIVGPAIKPTPVNIVDLPTIQPTPINVVEIPTIQPTPIQVVEVNPPIVPSPVINLPGILN